jgi:hypothetical protein
MHDAGLWKPAPAYDMRLSNEGRGLSVEAAFARPRIPKNPTAADDLWTVGQMAAFDMLAMPL